MKRARYILSPLGIFFSLLAININAQTYPLPVTGAKWNILIYDFGYFCTLKYEYEKDTFMCGNNYAVIRNKNQSSCNWTSPILLRSAGTLVYGRRFDCTSNEYLYYDFGLNVGDTFIVALNLFDSAVVTNITYPTMLNGQIRKSIALQSINPFANWQYSWIEGIGDIIKGLLSQYNPPDPVFTLLCFSDSSGLVYQYSNTCDTTSVNAIGNNFFQYSFTIYPNPSFEEVHLKYVSPVSAISYIRIYDALGRLIRIHDLESPSGIITINNSGLPDGLYACSLYIDAVDVITKKFIIQSAK